jgi:cell division septum initiation protein DivIVA
MHSLIDQFMADGSNLRKTKEENKRLEAENIALKKDLAETKSKLDSMAAQLLEA